MESLFNARVEKIRESGDEYEVFTLDSVSALLEQAETSNPKDRRGNERSSTGTHPVYVQFTGTKSWEEAVEIYRRGWESGVSAIEAQLNLPASGSANRYTSDIVGYTPNVGRYLAGRPDSMRRKIRRETPAKNIELNIDLSIHKRIKAAEILSAASLLVQAIMSLENAGATLRINTVCASDVGYQVKVRVKDYQDSLSINDIAFSCGHPSYLRRFIFRYLDSLDSERIAKYDIDSTKGVPVILRGARTIALMDIIGGLSTERIIEKILKSQNIGDSQAA